MTRASIRHTMNHRDLLDLFRSSHRRRSVKKGVLKNFANFTGRRLCWSLFLITLQVFKPAVLLKRYSYINVFLRNLRNFKSTYFEEYLRKIASICFTSKYYSKYWWQVWTRREFDRVHCKYFFKRNNFIQSNTAI